MSFMFEKFLLYTFALQLRQICDLFVELQDLIYLVRKCLRIRLSLSGQKKKILKIARSQIFE